MANAPSHLVSANDLEDRLAELQREASRASAGIFGPHSISWKINRESALFLAAGRAALLQLAHPWVATAIAKHSKTLDDPVSRFHNTFRVIFTMVFGTTGQALAAARRLHHRHQGIRGTLSEATGNFAAGSYYQANHIDALRWVYATLVDSALLAYELVLPQLNRDEREMYYAESRKMAALFGLPGECLPKDWADFRLYMQSMESHIVGVNTVARSLAHQLQGGAGLQVPPPFWYRALTLELLPARWRTEFHFAYEERERRAAARAVKWLRRIYPKLPPALRFVGPYNEAQARLRSRLSPSLSVRLSNRLWIGQASLFHSPGDFPS